MGRRIYLDRRYADSPGKWGERRKVFSLIEKPSAPQFLMNAWNKVRANKGAAGVDKISIQNLKQSLGEYLNGAWQELQTDTYNPKAVRRQYIPKEKGKTRALVSLQ